MDHERVAEMLTLWGIWSRAGQVGPRANLRCGSLERNHVSSRLFDDPPPPEPRVADDLGLRIEKAVVAAGRMFSMALAMMYVNEMPVEVIARRLGVTDAGRVLDQAHQAVAARLR